jgi:antitoxin VapB
MALTIRDPETETLATEIAAMTGESKTCAVKVALQERRQRLAVSVVQRDRRREFLRVLEKEIWPLIPPAILGKKLSRRERERILGHAENLASSKRHAKILVERRRR